MLIDLHVHAGAHGLALDDLIRRALEIGLDGVALVGDDSIPDVTVAAANEHLRLFAGAEVATDRGHYLVFLPRPREMPPLPEIFGPPPETRWPVRDVLARTAALGGAVVASRPYDTTVDHPGGDILYTLGGLTAVEVVAPLHPREIAFPAIEAAECLGLPCVGGSGARGSADDLGRGATLFTHAIQDEVELIAALRSGSCWPVEFGTAPAHVLRQDGPGSGRPPPSHRREATAPPRRR